MSPAQLYNEATRRGLRLEPRGGKLAVIPAKRLAPDFADVLRAHKRELLDWLETRTLPLAPDSRAWLHVARQVLAGEFDTADKSMRESVTIGLRSIQHPQTAAALERLRGKSIRP